MNWCHKKLADIKRILSTSDKRLWPSKAFYASFYVAVGALFPYLPVYFKQLNLSSHQNGILIGIRPLIQFFVTPLWGACADKFCKTKAIFLLSVFGWLLSNALLAFVPVSKTPELCNFQSENLADEASFPERNDTKPQLNRLNNRRYIGHVNSGELRATKNKRNWDLYSRVSPYLDPTVPFIPITFLDFPDLCGRTSLSTNDSSLFNQKNWTNMLLTNLTTPRPEERLPLPTRNSSYLRPLLDFPGGDSDSEQFISCNSEVFIFLLLVTILGTIISAPAQMLADTATLHILGTETYKYGRVRLWGSLGWGVGGFSVGAAVSSNYKKDHCGEVVIDYLPCFYVYAVAMGVAFLCGTQFKFDQNTTVTSENHSPSEESLETHRGISEGLKVFRSVQFCFVISIAFFCGSATGFIETFLFWYLHDLGGGQLLFSVVNGLNCTAEVCVFFITDKLLRFLGYVNVICLALFCYSVRFLYFYFVMNPWAVLPAELLQGITTAAFWSSCVSYVGLHPGASNTIQGILNGVYMGLGFSMGGFGGGILVHFAGMRVSFLLYALISLLLLLLFISLNRLNIK